MNRANVTYPYNKEGVKVFGELDAMMLKYYRVPNGTEEGALSLEAFEVGQRLQFYFAAYNAAVINEQMEGMKFTFPDGSKGMALAGIEAPFYLILNNKFFQDNFQILTSAVINELTRMNTSRHLPEDMLVMTHAIQLSTLEYLSIIAGLVGGTVAQREMDIEIKKHNAKTMEVAIESLKKMGRLRGDV